MKKTTIASGIIVIILLAIIMIGVLLINLKPQGAVIGETETDCETERQERIDKNYGCVTQCFKMTSEIANCIESYGYDRYTYYVEEYIFVYSTSDNCEDYLNEQIENEKEKYIGLSSCVDDLLVDAFEGTEEDPDPICNPHSMKKCSEEDVYWYDSCNNREDKYQECGIDGCEDGQCITQEPDCTSDEDCSEGKVCTEGECVDEGLSPIQIIAIIIVSVLVIGGGFFVFKIIKKT